MNLWRLLFGRRAAVAPPEPASLEPAKPVPEVSAPEVSAPAVSFPRVHVPSVEAAEPEAQPVAGDPQPIAVTETSAPESEISQSDGAADHDPLVEETESVPEGAGEIAAADPESRDGIGGYGADDTDEPAPPEPEISPLRLDQALKRLRDENPASSEESPPDLSE